MTVDVLAQNKVGIGEGSKEVSYQTMILNPKPCKLKLLLKLDSN
jgi:hypothetical protein